MRLMPSSYRYCENLSFSFWWLCFFKKTQSILSVLRDSVVGLLFIRMIAFTEKEAAP
jgi:hypothetical protein